MSIVQISKIQQRSGNLVDLPQLDEAEFGWASDARKLYIGKTTPNENIEVLTSYSSINLSQINGAVGNLNISNVTVANGQVLAFDGTNWVNKGGDAGGLLTLGEVSNVKITGGAIGYVLETDGTGNLTWTPKSSIVTFIENVTQADPAVVTTTVENFLTNRLAITITGALGMTELNGNTYYVDVLTANTFALYTDPGLTSSVDSTGYNAYAYTTVTATDTLTDQITVADSSVFAINDPVVFSGDLGNSSIVLGQTYYIKTTPSGTAVTISESVGGNTFDPGTEASASGSMFAANARAIASVASGAGGNGAQGSNTSVQYNNNNLLDGDASFTWDFANYILNVNGNANVGNLNSNGVVTTTRLLSNVGTGTSPLQVNSTTRVANLNVSYSNVSDFEVVTAQTTGTFYPVFVNGTTTANYALGSNANLSFNAATSLLSMTNANVTSNLTAANANITSLLLVSANANVTGNLNVTANANITANLNTNNASVGNLLTVGANANVTGNLNVTANANVTANLNANNINASNVLTVGANANVTGNLNVANNAVIVADMSANNGAIGNLLTVGANANVIGNLNVTSNIATNANLSANNGSINNFLSVGANANVTGNLNVIANANITANLSANNGAIGNLLTVGANANVTGNLNVTANANVTANLRSNNANILNLLLVGANANVTGNLNVTANANVTANLNANNINASNLLTVGANANVTGNLNVVSSANVTGNVNITANLAANNGAIGNLLTVGANANVTGNLNVTANIVSAANLSANNGAIGNLLTVGANANVTGNLNVTTNAVITANLSANNGAIGNLLTVGANANVTGNLNVTANANVTANVNANNVIASNLVSATLLTGTLTTAAQPNVTSVGTLTGLAVSGNVNFTGSNVTLGSNSTVRITGGTGGQLLSTDGSGSLSWVNQGSVIGGAAGSNTQIQYNALNLLAGSANFTFNYLTNVLNVNGNISSNGTIGGASADLYGNVLTTGANTTAGTITGNWTLSSGSRLQATYADLAEYYEADDVYVWGTVLEFGGDKEVTLATNETTRVAGVVSKNPAYVMNATCPGLLTAVALQGRVPCKVQGSVRKGDIMVSAGGGYAKASTAPVIGTVIGKALENFDGYEGIIEVAVGRL